MKMRAYAVAMGLLCLATAVFAQAIGVPSLLIPSPTGSEQIQVTNTGPQIPVVSIVQLRDAAGYSKQAPLTGTTIAVGQNVSRLVLNPAGTLAALTITFPASPVDGQVLFIFSTQILTSLTLQIATGSGQTINNGVTTFAAANTTANYIYSASNKTWDRD